MDAILILKGVGFLLLFLIIAFGVSYLVVEVLFKKYEENQFWKDLTDEERRF